MLTPEEKWNRPELQANPRSSGRSSVRTLFNRIQSTAIENANQIPKCGSSERGDLDRRFCEGKDDAFDDVMLWMIETWPELRTKA